MSKKPLYNWIIDALCLAAIAAVFVMIILRWPMLPDRIPTHFDLNGNVNGYGGKGTLIVLPAVALLMFVPITILEFYPQVWNTGVKVTARNADAVYRYLRMMMVSIKLLTVLLMCTMAVLFCYSAPVPAWIIPAYVVLMTAAIVLFLIKASRAGKR